MDLVLDPQEARVLGCLLEKQLATPEYYPLSLNALTNACNQKSNRQPVVAYADAEVDEIADRLIAKGVVRKSVVGRVPKYEELFTHERHLVPREAAILCELLLRGPQTAGELRGRATRLYNYTSVEELQETLENLSSWGYLRQLARMPGHKECRFAHLLSGEPTQDSEVEQKASLSSLQVSEAFHARVEKIEQEVADLRAELDNLNSTFALFRRQFE